MKHVIVALYHFSRIEDPRATQALLLQRCQDLQIKGTLLVADEGINGTLVGSRDGIDALLVCLRALPGFAGLEHKESFVNTMVFAKLKVLFKPEIVKLGQPLVDPQNLVGQYLNPSEWNAFVNQPDVVLIDTRNDYEVEIGSFKDALNPKTKKFSEFPDWWQHHKEELTGKKIAMFCTGGIRCEKSTSWLLSQGFTDVYHLRGGILKYLEEIPASDSLWQGDCFVFDERVAVGHGLEIADFVLCDVCGSPTPKGQEPNAVVRCQRCVV